MFFSDYCQAAVHLVAKLWRDDDRRKYGQRETRGFLKYFCPCKLLVLRMETEACRPCQKMFVYLYKRLCDMFLSFNYANLN